MRLSAGLMCLAAGCSSGPDRPPPSYDGVAISLSVDQVPFAELDVPGNSRPDGRAPEADVPIPGPWRMVATRDGRTTWEAPLPVRPRSLFFFRPLPGMAVLDPDGKRVPFRADHAGKGEGWRFNARTVTLTRPTEAGAPEVGAWRMRYPLAADRERRLNLEFSGLEPTSWSRGAFQVGPTTRSGVLLPAPGVAAWDIEIPPAAELYTRIGLIPPETADGPASDGATAVVEVEVDGAVTEVFRGHVDDRRFEPLRLDLSPWSGKAVRLRFRSEPGPTATFDYLLFADPTVTPRRAAPRRVVLVFVDTLRPDHLSTYGYDRPTSPSLDALAEGAVVFDAARSVAPWTLPSARTVVTGRHPEAYDHATTLQHRLRQEGFDTAMFAGNVYLSSNFDMERDWALHRVVNKPAAAEQVDQALAWLDAADGRDALLMLHFMDAHLPYAEPVDYRFLYAGTPPGGLGERFSRGAVVSARLDEAGQAYVEDRYDNTIRYVHDELERLFERLGPNDVVVYFADHGEEFWEHGGFEHGHTLHDELLRVPLVIRAPGLAPARVDAPVSLLDVTPTVLDALGLPYADLDGQSLLPAARGDAGAADSLRERGQIVGRPLYGTERWGAIAQQRKWTTTAGASELYDLEADAGELNNLLKKPDDTVDSQWMARAGEALGRPVVRALRLVTSGGAITRDIVATVVVPGGIAAAWVGADPTDRTKASVALDGDHAVVTWPKGSSAGREVYVLPAAPLEEATAAMTLTLDSGKDHAEVSVKPAGPPLSRRSTLGRGTAGGRQVQLTLGVAPLPAPDTGAIVGYDPEVASMLQQLGYVDDDDPRVDSEE